MKKKTLFSHEGRVGKFRAKAEDLVGKHKNAAEDEELKTDLDSFFNKWDGIVKRYFVNCVST